MENTPVVNTPPISLFNPSLPKPDELSPNSDWTLIDLWLIDKTEVPAHYQEDYDNFHTMMNRYLRNKTQLEDVLSYLLRYNGKFLHLPRHSKGKSKGRLHQTAIREGMEKVGFSFKKSNYSRVLGGL